MPTLATWYRECDEPLFARFFSLAPWLDVLNARVAPVDPAAADALLLTGGADIAAPYLKQEIADLAVIESDADPARDAWEFAAIPAILAAGKPVLAICKGVQTFNVALGGTLHLDIAGHNLPEQRDGNVQPLRFATNPTYRFENVNSSHHQALDKPGDGLEVEAWHAGDGIIEQVRLRDYPYAVGVQYHPERDAMYAPLFHDFFSYIRR